MKKLMIVLLSLGLAYGASAQRGHFGGGYHGGFYGRPQVVVGFGAYSPFYYPYYGFGLNPFYPYSPYYGNGYGYHRPSKLDQEIADIKNDYADKIWAAKSDKTLTHKERRQTVRNLKYQRDKEINDAKRNYYKY